MKHTPPLLRRIALGSALAIAMALAIAGVPQVAQAYTTTGCKFSGTNHSVGVTGLPSAYNNPATSAVALWSTSSDLNLSSTSTASVNGLVGNYGANGLAGQANWTCSFGATQGCTASLNTYYANAYGASKKRTVWLHELGHCFGLNHSTITTAVMLSCPGCAYDNGQISLHNDDKTGMNSLY